MPEAIDIRTSTQWAIASLSSLGGSVVFGASRNVFDLVNLNTGRAHRLVLITAEIGIGWPASGSFTASAYTSFHTPGPVNFSDFDEQSALLRSESAILYSYSHLWIWDHPLHLLADVTLDGGWGWSTPGLTLGNGITSVDFGDGLPQGDLGTLTTIPQVNRKEPPQPTSIHVTNVEQDELAFELAGDALFDFDKATIKPEAAAALEYAGKVVRSKPGRVIITGYTDSIGDDAYNQGLSERRAEAVRKWLTAHKYVKDANVEASGSGSQYPAVDNTDRHNTPANRERQKENRRVTIVIHRR